MKPDKILYISYDGMCEPLGQSQVLSYLKLLSKDWDIELISFEKPGDFQSDNKMSYVEEVCTEHGIKWTPFKYHKSPTLIATFYDVLMAWFYILKQGKTHYSVLHARSYVPMLMALPAKLVFRVSTIFDMRGFWADEKVDAGSWQRGLLYKLVKSLEKLFIYRADKIISLTQNAVDEILSWPSSRKLEANKFHVISTCVSNEKFIWNETFPSEFRLGYVGGARLWYDFPKVLGLFNAILLKNPQAHLHIVNKSEHDYIKECIQFAEVPLDKVTLESREHHEMAEVYKNFSFGVFFIRNYYSKKASMPTKLAEFMATGTPVITGEGIGDVDQYLSQYKAGIMIGDDPSSEDMKKIEALLDDPEVRKRCRQMAEVEFDLKTAVEKINKLYVQLSSHD